MTSGSRRRAVADAASLPPPASAAAATDEGSVRCWMDLLSIRMAAFGGRKLSLNAKCPEYARSSVEELSPSSKWRDFQNVTMSRRRNVPTPEMRLLSCAVDATSVDGGGGWGANRRAWPPPRLDGARSETARTAGATTVDLPANDNTSQRIRTTTVDDGRRLTRILRLENALPSSPVSNSSALRHQNRVTEVAYADEQCSKTRRHKHTQRRRPSRTSVNSVSRDYKRRQQLPKRR